VGVNTPEADEVSVQADVLACFDQSAHHVVEIGDQYAGMTLLGRSEILFDSEMQFDGGGAKSRPAASREGGRFIDLDHAEDADKEVTGILLRIFRHCQLHVMKPVESHTPTLNYCIHSCIGPRDERQVTSHSRTHSRSPRQLRFPRWGVPTA
jgi:hypothetical protein